MILALRSPSANGSPRHEVGHILRRNGVEKFTCRGHAHVINGQQQLSGER